MFFLRNSHLTVELLNPADPTDAHLLGTRFARGGYLWQVRDLYGVPLLSGPEWPAIAPDPYHGQGMPESFVLKIETADAPALHGALVPFLGAGSAHIGPGEKRVLGEPCAWSVTEEPNLLEFCTRQTAGNLSLCLTRSIQLHGNTVVSRSRLVNDGRGSFSVTWFAHPDFPLDEGRIACELPAEYRMKENPDFSLSPTGHFTLRRPFLQQADNHLEWISGIKNNVFRGQLTHPTVGHVRVHTDFAPDRCGIWANRHTFSVEPYLSRALPPGESHTWSVTYSFGG